MAIEKNTALITLLCIIGVFSGIASGSIVVFWVITVLMLGLCIYTGKKEEKILNPYYFFALTPFTLIIYKNISNNYMMDLTAQTWLIALLNIASFVLAMLWKKETQVKENSETDGLENNSLEFHTVVLALIGITPALLYDIVGIAIPFYSVLSLLVIPALCCAIKSNNKKLMTLVMIANALSWINNVSKSTILTVCLCIIISYESFHNLDAKKKAGLLLLCIAGVVVMLAAFTFANQARGVKTAESQLEYYSRYGNVQWNGFKTLFMPYMYLETPWTNLQYVMQTQNTRTYGLWLIKPLINYLQIDSAMEDAYKLIPMSSFNTYTFIVCNFKDFGFWGSAISSIILGCFVKWVYSRAKQSKNPLDVACYVFVAQAVLEMFFSNHFFQQSYPFTCVIILEIYKWIGNRFQISYRKSEQTCER